MNIMTINSAFFRFFNCGGMKRKTLKKTDDKEKI
jgi:hypothetical protein